MKNTARPRKPARQVTYTEAASKDLGRLDKDDPSLAGRAANLVKLLAAGEITGIALAPMRKYGDLTVCHKIYFGTPSEPKSHRIVYQEGSAKGAVEVLEVVAVEARDDGYVYLQAAKRLGRLPEESEAHLKKVHQRRIRDRAGRTSKKPTR